MNPLPDHLIGAYTHFNDALRDRHGLSVKPLHYLRLVLDAANTPGIPAHAGRYVVELLISGRRVRCLYDPRGSGALVTAFRPEPVIPQPGRQRTDHVTLGEGIRRKHSRKKSKAERRLRAYKRPCPGKEPR